MHSIFKISTWSLSNDLIFTFSLWFTISRRDYALSSSIHTSCAKVSKRWKEKEWETSHIRSITRFESTRSIFVDWKFKARWWKAWAWRRHRWFCTIVTIYKEKIWFKNHNNCRRDYTNALRIIWAWRKKIETWVNDKENAWQ